MENLIRKKKRKTTVDQLSNISLEQAVKNIRITWEPYLSSPGCFSWVNFKLSNGVSALPEPLNQGGSLHCILYSTISLFKFQLTILSLYQPIVRKFTPSQEYLREVALEEHGNTVAFMQRLTTPFCDTAEYLNVVTGKIKRDNAIRRFKITYEFLDATAVNSLSLATKAVANSAGVVLSFRTYERDANGHCVYHGNRRVPSVTMPPNNLFASQWIQHAVFAYGVSRLLDGKAVIEFLDSYGVHVGINGHNHVDWDDVSGIHIARLMFNANGF